MRIIKIIGLAAAIAGVLALPAAAKNPSPMKKGAVMAMMPDGSMMMMTKMPKGMMKDDMMKMAKPMSGCMIMMMGDDGKMYMMDDMKMADGTMACAGMFKHR